MKTKRERIIKINKDRRFLMKLLHQLRVQIIQLLQDKEKNQSSLTVLFKRRKDYRKRLTKLTNKRHEIKSQRGN